MESQVPGTLYLVGTPVGNLEDITLRALRVLKEVELIAAEDTRRIRKLTSHYGIPARAVSLHRHNEAARCAEIAGLLGRGGSVALVSDAGMPGVSDPGAALVRLAAARGIPVTVVPGPSAIVAALAVSGFEAPAYVFAGFLPRRPATRRDFLAALAGERRPVVFFEAPHRIMETLADIERVLGDRPLAVGRELTKRFEQVLRGTPAEVRSRLSAGEARGEFTVVLGPAPRGARSDSVATPAAPGASATPAPPLPQAAAGELATLRARGVGGAAALREVARRHGVSRNAAYRALKARKQAEKQAPADADEGHPRRRE